MNNKFTDRYATTLIVTDHVGNQPTGINNEEGCIVRLQAKHLNPTIFLDRNKTLAMIAALANTLPTHEARAFTQTWQVMLLASQVMLLASQETVYADPETKAQGAALNTLAIAMIASLV